MIFIIFAIAALVVGYLLGSVNFAIIITRLFAKQDIREHGSGNAGLTNVLRTLGKGPAILTLIGDFSKGILSVLIIRLFYFLVAGQNDPLLDFFACYGALLGHVFPIYYGFRGGKGILVSFGAIMILSPYAGLICFAGFLITVFITKYVSLGSIIAGVLFPLTIALMGYIYTGAFQYVQVLMALPISIIIVYMHRENIKRLINHNENKISFKKKS